MTAAPHSTSILVFGACLGSSLWPSIVARLLKHEEPDEGAGQPNTRGQIKKEKERELELAGYLLEDLVKVHPSLRSVDTKSCHTRVI